MSEVSHVERLYDLIFDMKKDLGEVKTDVGHIKGDTIRNTTNLEVHMKRTDQNETLIEMQNKRITKLENHDRLMNALWKISLTLVGLTGTVIGIIVAIRQIQ